MSDAYCCRGGLRQACHDIRPSIGGVLAMAEAGLLESARARLAREAIQHRGRVGEGMADAACAV